MPKGEEHITDAMMRLNKGSSQLRELKQQRAQRVCPPGHRYVPEHCVGPAVKTKSRAPLKAPQVAAVIRELEAGIKAAHTDIQAQIRAQLPNSQVERLLAQQMLVLDHIMLVIPDAVAAVARRLQQGSSPVTRKWAETAIEGVAKKLKISPDYYGIVRLPGVVAAVLRLAASR